METSSVIGFIFSALFYGVVATFISGAAFRYLGKKWLDSIFESRLEVQRHEQAKELQKLKVQVDSTVDSISRLQEKEFAVASELWSKLQFAIDALSDLVAPLQRYPDIERMRLPEVNEYLEGTTFTETEKGDILDAKEKNKVLQNTIYYHKYYRARQKFAEFRSSINQNLIFLEAGLSDHIEEISDSIWSSIISKEVGYEAEDWKIQSQGWDTFKDEVLPKTQELRQLIRAYLRKESI